MLIVCLSWFIKLGLSRLKYFKHRAGLQYVTAFLATIIILCVCAIIYSSILTRKESEKFDEVVWIDQPENRHKMIDDLLESDYLIGKKREQIKNLFGEPLSINKENNKLQYELIGQNWAEFEIFRVSLYFENDRVSHFTYEKDE